jgi:Restriction endonuclease NaeI
VASRFDASDPALDQVLDALGDLDPVGTRMGEVIRETYDQLYDGGRTGRYRWSQLFKTEKTHFGTLVEINLQREFAFRDGLKLDYRIAGHEIDAKFSQDLWKWMLPPEAVGELCLVVTANDETSRFSAGVVRATVDRLGAGTNRDAKKTLSLSGRQAVVWLFRDEPFPPNVLLQLPTADVDAIFAQRSGQQRLNELFRRAVRLRVSRAAVETVAQQRDPLKRVRSNGGARQALAREGIAIFGGDYLWQRRAAMQLGLPVPGDSEFVSAYLKRVAHVVGRRPAAELAGEWWELAGPGDADQISPNLYRFPRDPWG